MEDLLKFVERFVLALPGLLQAGIEVTAIAQQFKTMYSDMRANNRSPTAAEWQWLNDTLDPLEQRLQSDSI